MTPLTPHQIVELRAELERLLARLERSMRVTDAALAPVQLDQTAVGRLSRMDSLQNQSLTKNLAERERAQLASILAALDRIEAGTYGVCVDCGEPQPFGRLYVVPDAATCAGCGG
jgi:DnaK suppressor protein